MTERRRTKQPNLLFLLVDQMRYHAMGCAGNPDVRTPHLDRLASEGVCCETAVSTSPVCTPARACLLTGRFPLEHTTLVNNSMLPVDMPSLGTCLKAAGYATGHIGKWHLAGEGFIGKTEFNGGHEGWIPPGPMRHGFDYWATHHCTHKYRNAFYYRDTPEPVPAGDWEPDHQTDLAVNYIRDHAQSRPDQPFGLVVSWGTPHTPFIAPPEYEALYDPERIELRPNVQMTEWIRKNDNGRHNDDRLSDEAMLRRMTANYYGAVTNIDDNLGRLLAELDRLGLAEDTLVVFTSDHGEMLGSHGMMHKTVPYDESILVPLLLRFPAGLPAGVRFRNPIGLADVLPTLFGLMDLDAPDGVEGADYGRAFCGDVAGVPVSTPVIWPCCALTWGKEWTHCRTRRGRDPAFIREYRAIRTETHLYARDRQGPWLLFDHRSDPYQRNNLVEKHGPGVVPADVERELEAWLERTRDPFESTEYYMERIELETGRALRPEEFTR